MKQLARGRLLKTKVREAKKIAEAETKARLTQYYKVKDKQFMVQLKSKLLGMIENINPIEALAVMGGAIAVHDIIFNLDEFVTQVQAWKNSERIQTKILASIEAFGIPIGGIVLEMLKGLLPTEFQEVYGDKPNYVGVGLQGEIVLWLLAIAISYFVFKHGGDLLNIAKSFFGFVLLAVA